MVIKSREEYNKRAERYGKYYVVRLPQGGFNIWKDDWKGNKGLYVPNDDRLRKRYREQKKKHGELREAFGTLIAARGVLECGKFSRPEGRKALGLPPGYVITTEEEALLAVRDYWMPRGKGHGYIPTKNVDKGVFSFGSEHPRIYKYIHRHLGGFKEAMEKWYPYFYNHISHSRRIKYIEIRTKEKLAQELINRFNTGLCISPTYLLFSPDKEERKLFYRVLDFARGDLFDKRETYTETVSRLTGLPAEDIKISEGANKKCSELIESLTEFLFYWSSLLGIDAWGFNLDKIHHTKYAARFKHKDNGKMYEADLRIGNSAMEVKAGVGKFSNERKSIKEKYGKDGCVWETGEDVEKGAFIFHAKPSYYRHFAHQIKEMGWPLITYKDFHEHLRRLIKVMKEKHSMYKGIRPEIRLDSIIDLHEEISLHPFLLLRNGNRERRAWIHHALEALIEKAQELRSEDSIKCQKLID